MRIENTTTVTMSSSSSVTPARSSTLSSNSSASVPTDLTVSSVSASTDTEARRGPGDTVVLQSSALQQVTLQNKSLQHKVRLLEAELTKRDLRLEEVRREAEVRVETIEAGKQEAIQTNVELRLALHARWKVLDIDLLMPTFTFREMNKVQTAINAQLEQVIERQRHLGKHIAD